MIAVTPSGAVLGATVTGIDLAAPLADADYQRILEALGAHAVLRFPGQDLAPAAQKAFAGRFGSLEVNVSGMAQIPGHPEMMVLSNIVEDGRPIGFADAGQGWHTDMSYSRVVAFGNVLHALKVPRNPGGKPLGNTRFADMRAAYDGLPAEIKAALNGRTATHDFNKFWEMMRRKPGSGRPPLTDEQRRRKPPVSHPLVLVHPVSGRPALYANPGYTVRIDGLPEDESDALLRVLFAHQLRPEYRCEHQWSEGDLLFWDNLATLHEAAADYGPDQPRLMHRCQVMADRILGPTAA